MASMSAVSANTGSVVDSSAITNFDFAICMVCAWLVPRLVSHHRLYHRSLQRNPAWVRKHVSGDPGPSAEAAARDGYASGNPQLAFANSVVNWAMLQALGFAALFYTVTAIVLSLMTRDLDYRTSFILKGISFFIGAFYIFLLSFNAPQWLAVYAAVNESRRTQLGDGLASLATRVRLSTGKTFVNVFPLMAPFFCGAKPATIPASIVIGFFMGFFLCLIIDFGNRTIKNATQLKYFALTMALAMVSVSALIFSYGCAYVDRVWGDRKGQDITAVDILTFTVWFLGGMLLHALQFKITNDHNQKVLQKQRQQQALKRMDHKPNTNTTARGGAHTSDTLLGSVTQRPQTFFGKSVYGFSEAQLRNIDPMSMRNIDPSTRNINTSNQRHDDVDTLLGRVTQRPQTFFGKSVYGFSEAQLKNIDPSSMRNINTSTMNHSSHHDNNTPMESVRSVVPPIPENMETLDEIEENSNSESAHVVDNNTDSNGDMMNENHEDQVFSAAMESPPPQFPPPQEQAKRDSPAKMVPQNSKVHFDDSESPKNVEGGQFETVPDDEGLDQNDSPNDDNDEPSESCCHLVNVVCCDLTCGAGGKSNKSSTEKLHNCCSWFVWSLLFAASMFFILILVGSQFQEKTVRANLPRVHEILYGDMNTGPMCAFDNRGTYETRREKVEATQRTFWTPEDARLANYTILHCGACGKCSNYHDLRLEYATRNILGQVALECAKKALFGGGYQTLLECTMEKTTFLEPCARCWATDMECTKKHCMWIGIRAFMINSVTNLQVGADDITPATCEEAMCEASEITEQYGMGEGFVPCSGASRRRMNVTSTISRPLDQQCRQVMVKWEEFFGPSKGELDYDPAYDNIIGRRQ
ncbi:expressed unknown protein [Seminavis robusta]|uniref:Uncharacterized protein n=1 Tax=Seminavis robusta TaxID=568900 RepID=A0A9N8DAD4_9STRA|nr:expressed unknown protein [Seminavis robusta]|eukprot:Sro33_g021510.1 n/a (867) ;mRNA; r:94590-97321